MKVIILGDFGGTFSNTLFRALKDEKADLILGTGDYADIKPIAKLFLKHGDSYAKYFTKEVIEKVRARQLKTGTEVLSKLESIGTPCKIILGNNDIRKQKEFISYIRKAKNLELIHKKTINNKGLKVYGWSVIEHSHKNIRKEHREFAKILDKSLPKGHEYVFLTHLPPWNSALDVNLNKKRNYKKHVGSKVVNHVLWHHTPKMILCGHLEEHTGECVKRGVRVINPGAAERNQYAVMEFDGDYSRAKIQFWKATVSGKRKARLTDKI
jgi:Icc-related predicted phosphoesterase